jgi:hypothetical protein
MDDEEVLERAKMVEVNYARLKEIDATLERVPLMQQERAQIIDQLRAIFLTPPSE